MDIINHRAGGGISADAMGVEVSWSFGAGGATDVVVRRSDMEAILRDMDYDLDHLSEVNEVAALRRAAKLAPSRATLMVKPLARPSDSTPLVMGVYTRDTAGDEARGDDWALGARVRAEAANVVALPPEGTWDFGTPQIREVATTMATNANMLMAHLYNEEIGAMLVSIGQSLGWFSRRRNSGGVYYITAGPGAERFVQLMTEIRSLTATEPANRRFFPEIIEVYPSPASRSTIFDSATAHFETEIARIGAQLCDAIDKGTMREKTFDKRIGTLRQLEQQAADLKYVLDEQSGNIAKRLSRLRAYFNVGRDAGLDNLKDVFSEIQAILGQPTEV